MTFDFDKTVFKFSQIFLILLKLLTVKTGKDFIIRYNWNIVIIISDSALGVSA